MKGDMHPLADELKLTYDDILTLGESNRPMELFDGEFIMSAMPDFHHQFTATRLTIALDRYVSVKKLGVVLGNPMDVVLSESIVLQPDLFYYSHNRAHINDGKKLNASPDLVVEILSASTEERDRTFKFREYARGGAKEYWLVSPEKKEIEVYKNSEKGFQLVKIFRSSDILNSPLFTDIQLKVDQVFE